MTDYNDLITRLRSMDGIGDIQLNELMNRKTPMVAADAIAELVARLAESEDTNKALRVRLGSELERANELVADLQAECSFLLAKRAEREKPKPVAHARKWFIDGEEPKKERKENGRMVWPFKFKLVPVSEGKLLRDDVPLYAAPPVITQHEPVTTVDDRHNADGKSCHITDDLPAGMPLYAAPPVAAPVRLTDEQAEKVDEAIREALGDAYDCLRVWNAWSYGTMGPDDFSQVAEDSDRVAEIRNAAAVALGFKLEGEQ